MQIVSESQVPHVKGTPFVHQLEADSTDPHTWSIDPASQNNFAVNESTGELTGTPSPGHNTVQVTLHDAFGGGDTQSLLITSVNVQLSF